MGMNSTQFSRFMGRVDPTLNALFPGTITIGETEYEGCAVGGDAALEYLNEGGQAPIGTRYFRIEKTVLEARPETGTFLTWNSPTSSQEDLTVIECPDRPHDTAWVLICKPRNR